EEAADQQVVAVQVDVQEELRDQRLHAEGAERPEALSREDELRPPRRDGPQEDGRDAIGTKKLRDDRPRSRAGERECDGHNGTDESRGDLAELEAAEAHLARKERGLRLSESGEEE